MYYVNVTSPAQLPLVSGCRNHLFYRHNLSYHELLLTACTFIWFWVGPWRQHSGNEVTSTNCTDCTFSWGKDTIMYCMYSKARQHTGTVYSFFAVDQQTNKCYFQSFEQQHLPNHAWGSVWLYYGMHPFSDRPQTGQKKGALFYSRANHTHSGWVRCPGMAETVVLGKAKDCSKNTVVINLVIQYLIIWTGMVFINFQLLLKTLSCTTNLK